MKRIIWSFVMIMTIFCLGSACAPIQQSALITDSSSTNEDPAVTGTTLPEYTGEDSPATSDAPDWEWKGPSSAANPPSVPASSGEGAVVAFRAVSGPYGDRFDQCYATFYTDESQRNRSFPPRTEVRFTKVTPGEHYVNFRWHGTNRWTVENDPPVNAEHRQPVGQIEVSINGSPWRRLTGADTVKVGGAWWNFRIVVP